VQVLEEIAAARKLLSPRTGEPLEVRGGRVVSADGTDFGPVAGPLNLLVDYEDTIDVASVSSADVARVRASLQLDSTPEVDAGIAQAIATTGMRFGQAHLSAESAMLEERFRAPEANSARATVPPAPRRGWLRRAKPPAVDARFELLSHSIGERLTAGVEVWRSVRVRNLGPASVPGASDYTVSSFFLDNAGKVVAGTEIPTTLPVDIAAGREMTLIVRIRPPSVPGAFQLCVSLVRQAPFLRVPVQVIPCELPVFAYEYYAEALEYQSDHHMAMVEMIYFLREQRPGQSALVLEIGGGIHPTGHSVAQHGYRVVSCDVSHAQSLLGSLYFRQKMPDLDESFAFVSCDGTRLPFGDSTFDAVMMVSAFHHFPDPVGMLEEMKRVTGPRGLIYLAGEVCAPNPGDERYHDDLRHGINEQMWTLAEFTEFFRRAGLRAARARVDYNSLKVGLVRA
jgi:ubiquinone/menaquinone biosynthesis C-methylase UbiE